MLTHLFPQLDAGNPINKDDPLAQGLELCLVASPLGHPALGAGGGGRWLDLCGKARHGTLTGGPTWKGASGRRGGWGAVDFDGAGGHVPTASCPVLATWTLTAWMYDAAGAGTRSLMALADSGLTSVNFYWRPGAGSGFTSTSFVEISTTRPATNVWTHGAFVYTGATLRQLLNGVVTDGPTAATGTPDNAGDPITLGRLGSFNAQFWQGMLDDVRVYSRALSDTEIYQLYEDSLRGYPRLLRRVKRTYFVQAAAPAEYPPWPLHAAWRLKRRRRQLAID